jgi:hypothetical protein
MPYDPHTDPANTPIRRQFQLPANRAFIGEPLSSHTCPMSVIWDRPRRIKFPKILLPPD